MVEFLLCVILVYIISTLFYLNQSKNVIVIDTIIYISDDFKVLKEFIDEINYFITDKKNLPK